MVSIVFSILEVGLLVAVDMVNEVLDVENKRIVFVRLKCKVFGVFLLEVCEREAFGGHKVQSFFCVSVFAQDRIAFFDALAQLVVRAVAAELERLDSELEREKIKVKCRAASVRSMAACAACVVEFFALSEIGRLWCACPERCEYESGESVGCFHAARVCAVEVFKVFAVKQGRTS